MWSHGSTEGHWVQPRESEKVVKEGITSKLGLEGRPVRMVRTGHSYRANGLMNEEWSRQIKLQIQ